MRKIFVIVLIIILLISVSACGNVEAVSSIKQYDELDELIANEIDSNAKVIDCVNYKNTMFAVLKISNEIEIYHFSIMDGGYSNTAKGYIEKINTFSGAEDVDYVKFILLEHTNGEYYLQVLANRLQSVEMRNIDFMVLNYDEKYELHIANISNLKLLENDITIGNKSYRLE